MKPLITTLAPMLLSACTALAQPTLVYETDDPFGGVFDVYGYDVNSLQSIAIRFTPSRDYSLELVELWLWNNSGSGDAIPVTVSIYDDSAITSSLTSSPGATRFESVSAEVPYTGFAHPRIIASRSTLKPLLRSGANYWIVVESDSPPGVVWAVAQPGTGFGAVRFQNGGDWRSFLGAVGATRVWGNPEPSSRPINCCAADFDLDYAVNVGDIGAFLRAWEASSDRADFDQNGDTDTQDMVSFLTSWINGCESTEPPRDSAADDRSDIHAEGS